MAIRYDTRKPLQYCYFTVYSNYIWTLYVLSVQQLHAVLEYVPGLTYVNMYVETTYLYASALIKSSTWIGTATQQRIRHDFTYLIMLLYVNSMYIYT